MNGELIIETGAMVRYPKTGTSGTVVRFIDRGGMRFAELDSTGLLYRLDQLIPAEHRKLTGLESGRDDQIKSLEQERKRLEQESMEEPPSLDGACSGAG